MQRPPKEILIGTKTKHATSEKSVLLCIDPSFREADVFIILSHESKQKDILFSKTNNESPKPNGPHDKNKSGLGHPRDHPKTVWEGHARLQIHFVPHKCKVNNLKTAFEMKPVPMNGREPKVNDGLIAVTTIVKFFVRQMEHIDTSTAAAIPARSQLGGNGMKEKTKGLIRSVIERLF